jgi:hypothetical protein
MKSGNRIGEILYWCSFSGGGKLYRPTDFENRGKLYAGALFPPMGEILSRVRFSGGKYFAGTPVLRMRPEKPTSCVIAGVVR